MQDKKMFSNKVSVALLEALDEFCEANHHAKNDAMAAGLVLFMMTPRWARTVAMTVAKRYDHERLTAAGLAAAVNKAIEDEQKRDSTASDLALRIWHDTPAGEAAPPSPAGLRLQRGAAGERYKRGRGQRASGDDNKSKS